MQYLYIRTCMHAHISNACVALHTYILHSCTYMPRKIDKGKQEKEYTSRLHQCMKKIKKNINRPRVYKGQSESK